MTNKRIEMRTLEEWKKSQTCNRCGDSLSMDYKNFLTGQVLKAYDLDGSKVKGFYCGGCGMISQAELMNERFVEVYKGEMIFSKDGKYSPYWGCLYYFKTLDDCRRRIDERDISLFVGINSEADYL